MGAGEDEADKNNVSKSPKEVEEKGENEELIHDNVDDIDNGITFDDILIKLGQFGRYQRRVYFLLFIPTIFSAMHKLSWVFLGATPLHRCQLPFEENNATTYDIWEMKNWIPTNKDDEYDQCERYVDPSDHTTKVPCESWVYDKSTFGSSAVMDWNLVCTDKGYKATAQSTFMIGVLLGSIIFGQLSDKFGRKPTFFASVIIQLVFSLGAVVAPEYWSFLSFRVVVGATTSGVFLVSYVLAMEMVGPKYRVLAGTLCQYYYTFGYFVMSLVAYYLNDNWKLLQFVLSIPMVLFVGYWWIVPESVRWHLGKGNYESAKSQIRAVAKENKVELGRI